MRKVKFIDDIWNPDIEWFQNVLKVGDPIPILGEVYTVKSTWIGEDGKEKAIELEEFNYSAYGIVGMFKASRFENVEWIYTPDSVIEVYGDILLAEKYTLYIDFPISEEERKSIYEC